MYHIEDEGAFIIRIQRYLISALQGESIPLSPIDGVYAEDTRSAVEHFQRISGLNPTGIVNEETYTLLYERHLFSEESADACGGMYSSEILRRGDKSEEVRRLNSYLTELFADERIPLLITPDDEYSRITEQSVRALQKKWNEVETGEANRPFRRRLVQEVEARNRRTNLIYTA